MEVSCHGREYTKKGNSNHFKASDETSQFSNPLNLALHNRFSIVRVSPVPSAADAEAIFGD